MMETVEHFGFEFRKTASLADIAEEIAIGEWRDDNYIPLLVTPNVDQLVKLNRSENESLKARLVNARVIIPDGQPIIWFSKWALGSKGLQHRLTGSDLFPLLWANLKRKQKRVLLILPNEVLGEGFQKEYDSVQTYSPPMFDLSDKKGYKVILEEIYEIIHEFRPEHISIGLGFPKQEQLALDILEKIEAKPPFISLLGASFEFYHGAKKRAPMWMQRMGLEFLHRMLSEPKRMIKRYLVDDIQILPIFWREYRKMKG